jgi:Na+/H+-dicarboxylate symporter
MLVVPLVLCSIGVGVASISDIRKIGVIGGKTILIYLLTTAIAVTVALLIGMLFKPGAGLDFTSVAQTANVTASQNLTNTIISIIPENPFNSMANGDMLPVILFGLLIGIILAKLKDKTEIFNKVFHEGNTIMMEMTSLVMKFAPIGVFCLMAKTFGSLGLEGLLPLAKYFMCVLLGLAVQGFVVYPALLVILTRLNPIRFFRRFFPVMFFRIFGIIFKCNHSFKPGKII